MRSIYRFDQLLTILLAILPLFPIANANAQNQISFCARVLTIDKDLLAGANQSPKEVKKVFQKIFPERNREFLVFQFRRKDKAPRRVHYNELKLRYVLIATDENRVIWQFEEFFRHAPTAFALSPTDSNVGFVAKGVERFYLAEEAPSSARVRPELPGNLSSDAVYEVLKISLGPDGQVKFKDLYTAHSQIYLGGFDENQNLKVGTLRRSEVIPSE